MNSITPYPKYSDYPHATSSNMYPVQAYQRTGTLQINNQTLTAVSRQIDEAARQVYEDLRFCLWQSPEHLNRLWTINVQPVNCGKTARASIILQDASAFEQMIALENWLHCYNSQLGALKERHTFCFSNTTQRLYGRAIPLSVEKNASSMWRVKIGNAGKEYHAPTYKDDWDYRDAWQDPNAENFIYSLEALEIVRQPDFIGATLIKGNAYESEYIDQDWRYGVTNLYGHNRLEACVEFSKQNNLSKEKTAIKLQSAAYNLFQLIAQGHGDTNLCAHTNTTRNVLDYFDSPQQIHHYFSLSVTPNEILEATNQTFLTSERSALYYKMFKLMLAKIGPQTTPSLRAFIIQRFNQAPFKLTLARTAS